MARPTLGTLNVRPHFLSILSAKLPEDAGWTVLEQGETFTPDSSADSQEYKRIGDKNALKIAGSVGTDIGITVYFEDDLKELAMVLGIKKPGGGWTGSEEIDLDPKRVIDFKVDNYNGTDSSAAVVSTEYIYAFRGAKFAMGLDANGEVRKADISGACAKWYMMPAAGT